MSSVLSPPRHVQACFTFPGGLVIREDGRSRPVGMDEIEQAYSQARLDEVMSSPGTWIDLVVPAVRCRCWSHPRGEWVAIVLPGIGKVQVSIDKATSDPAVLALFNRVLEADMLARRNVWKRDGSDKAYVDLTEAELNLVAVSALKPIARAVRHMNIAAFNPSTNPAA